MDRDDALIRLAAEQAAKREPAEYCRLQSSQEEAEKRASDESINNSGLTEEGEAMRPWKHIEELPAQVATLCCAQLPAQVATIQSVATCSGGYKLPAQVAVVRFNPSRGTA
jgi:hypothetical protein